MSSGPSSAGCASVGHHFALTALRVGETAADLGGGSGMGSCPASRAGDPEGRVIGIDIRDQQERVAACA